MKKMFFCIPTARKALFLMLLVAIASIAAAQPQRGEKTRLLLIVDCSESMWQHWQSATKIKVTQQVLLSMIDSATADAGVDIALRVFGHLNRDQIGTRLEVPFAYEGTPQDQRYRLQSKIRTLVPNGGCTAAAALTDALGDFPHDDNARNIILIVTDGIKECDAEVCAVAKEVQMSGVVVQTFVIGIGDDYSASTGAQCAGATFAVPDEEDFSPTLQRILDVSRGQARVVIEATTTAGEPVEAEHAVALYDSRTGILRHTTLLSTPTEGAPDTLLLDPMVDYDMVLFSTPPTVKHGLRFDATAVNRVRLTVAEGSLRIGYAGGRTVQQAVMPTVAVRQVNGKCIATQPIGQQRNYLSGTYDIEVFTTPPTVLKGVVVRELSATNIDISQPGTVIIAKPKAITTGTIVRIVSGKAEHVCDLNPDAAAERLMLQPGEYQVVLHPQGSAQYGKVQSRRFTVQSQQTTRLQF